MTEHPLHELIQRRRSGRAFDKRPVAQQTLAQLLEAARWAQSCFNLQPWRFVVCAEPQALEKLQAALAGGNSWAKEAPALIAIVSNEALDKVADDGRKYYLFDTGLAAQNLVLQAVSAGLMCHMMAGFDHDLAKAALGVPDGFEVICLMAVGYPGDPNALDDAQLRQRESAPRQRKPLEEIASFGVWNERLG